MIVDTILAKIFGTKTQREIKGMWRKWMETSTLARRFSARFIAGSNLDQAMDVCRELNSEGIGVTLDVLGESISSVEEAGAARDAYLRTLSAIHEKDIRSEE